MAKRTIKLNIKLPAGMSATDALVDDVTRAAEKAVASASKKVVKAQKIVDDMAKKGVTMTLDEVMERMSGTQTKRPAKKGAKKSARKRVVLTDEQREALIEDLKTGIKIKDAENKYGVSQATVTNIKKSQGLTKPKEG